MSISLKRRGKIQRFLRDHHHHQLLWVHCRTKTFPQPSVLIPISCLSIPGYSSKTSYLISVCLAFEHHLVCHSVTLTFHLLSLRLITCPAHVHLFSFNYAQDIFNFRLLPNPWCSLLLVSSCYISNIILSPFPFWAPWNFRYNIFIRLQVPDPQLVNPYTTQGFIWIRIHNTRIHMDTYTQHKDSYGYVYFMYLQDNLR